MTAVSDVAAAVDATALDATVRDALLPDLRRALGGTVHGRGEAAYDELVASWNLSVAMRPGVVVAARTAEDVAATVRVAARHGVTVGVQSTGHGAHSRLAGDVLVATRGLHEVTVHPEQGWVRWAPA
jgi:FAD/FMN-containing dehydrogenase